MEEADALADRAGIMAKRMLAMGTSSGLRRKFGGRYYVHLVLKSAPHTTDEETSQLKSWVLSQYPGADIEDKTYHGQIRFSVPITNETLPLTASSEKLAKLDHKSSSSSSDGEADRDGISGGSDPLRSHDENEGGSGIGAIITLLEDQRENLGLEHYSVSPTTLDQVFLNVVTKHDVEEEGYAVPKEKRGCCGIFGKN